MSDDIYQSPESNLESGNEEFATPSISEILFSFKGRILRKHYWFSLLAIYAVVFIIAIVLGAALSEQAATIGILVLYVPMIWIGLAVQIKRWHDRDKSGWWVFISLIPVIGAIWALVENGFLRGTEGVNRFGPPCA